MTQELKPCPFCGATASGNAWTSQISKRNWYRIGCDAPNPPGCPAEPFVDGETEAEAILAWNTRTQEQ